MKFNKITEEKAEHLHSLPAPIVPLVGKDGNAFAIMGRFAKGARKAGWIKENTDLVIAEMMSGDYDHLLGTAMEFVKESEDDDVNGDSDDDDAEIEYADKPGCSGDDSDGNPE